MNVLHMETDQVWEAARRMNEGALALWNRAEDLRATSALLSQAWRGGQADSFLQQLRAWLEHHRAQVEQLQTLALRLSREVEEWEQAAASCASTWREISLPPFDWIKVGDESIEALLRFLKNMPYDSALRVDYKDIGRLLNALVGDEKAGFVTFMDRFGHLVKSPVLQEGVPLGLGIWADYRESHDWKHALGSEVIEFGIDKGLMVIPGVGQVYLLYKWGMFLGHVASGAFELTGHHETAVWLQNMLDKVDVPERLGDAIYDWITHPPKVSLDSKFVAQWETHFACGF